MNIEPTLIIQPTQVFHFAPNTNSCGCCCFWRSRSVKKDYFVRKDGIIEVANENIKKVENRILANKRLAALVKSRFKYDMVDENQAFERLRKLINFDFDLDDRITEEQLISIVNAMYIVKLEFNRDSPVIVN